MWRDTFKTRQIWHVKLEKNISAFDQQKLRNQDPGIGLGEPFLRLRPDAVTKRYKFWGYQDEHPQRQQHPSCKTWQLQPLALGALDDIWKPILQTSQLKAPRPSNPFPVYQIPVLKNGSHHPIYLTGRYGLHLSRALSGIVPQFCSVAQ